MNTMHMIGLIYGEAAAGFLHLASLIGKLLGNMIHTNLIHMS